MHRWLDGKVRILSIPNFNDFVFPRFSHFVSCSGDVQRCPILLLQECEEPGIWRYWASRQGTVIDPDLDSTCCAAYALWGAQQKEPYVSNVERILTNRDTRGRFKTWLRGTRSRNDVDAVINANALLYLGDRGETADAKQFLIDAISDGREREMLWYYLSRSFILCRRVVWHFIKLAISLIAVK